ncbi:MAG: SpoIIIAH-like family protein [Lachnospiraceae bacterium]|nr:SpoIIIAH-like family protein [Lachnospiraceae bacterium]
MKKVFGKNQVIITALAIMIAVAGYLSVTKDEAHNAENLAGMETVDGQPVNEEQADVTYDISEEGYQLSDTGEIITDDITADLTDDMIAETTKDMTAETTDDAAAVTSEEADGASLDTVQTDELTADAENVGEAVLVSSTINAEYFSQAKLSREQTRSKNKEILMELVNSTTTTEEQKEKAVNEVIAITSDQEKETAAQNMLEAKGYGESIVSIVDESVDVIVGAANLQEKDIAQIEDIVKRKTGKKAENIVITPVGVQ